MNVNYFPLTFRPDSGSWPLIKGIRDHTHWTHHSW